MKIVVLLIFFLIIINNVYCLEYPLLKEQEGFFKDVNNNTVFLENILISDVNGITINNNNIQEKIDANQLRINIDDIDFRDSINDYTYNNDINNLRYKEVYFDYNQSSILINNYYEYVLDVNISRYKIYEDNYFIISDNNLLVYEYQEAEKEFIKKENIDTNYLINDIEIIDYNGLTYIFLANDDFGISVYEFFDTNKSVEFVKNVVFSLGGFDYISENILFEINNNKFIFSVHRGGGGRRAVVYTLEEIFTTENYTDQRSIDDNNYVDVSVSGIEGKIFMTYPEDFCEVNYSENGTYISYFCNYAKKRLFPTGDENLTFVVDDINKTHISSYNTNNLNAEESISSIDTNKTIYDVGLINIITDNNSTIYKIYTLHENGLTIIDYNTTSNQFNLIEQNNKYDINLDTTKTKHQSEYLLQLNTLNIGHKNKIITLSNKRKYKIIYYTPFPIKTLTTNITNITFSLYNSSSFSGDINTTFSIINDYIKDSNEDAFSFDIFLKNKNTLEITNIDENILLTEDICFLEEKLNLCSYIFNIKQINNQNALPYGEYDVVISIEDLNIFKTTTIFFNLTKPTTGGSSNTTNNTQTTSSSSTPQPPLEQSNIEEVDIIKNTIFLLEKEYLEEKDVFKQYLLEFLIDDISFDINYSKDLEDIKKSYEETINKYNQRVKIIVNEYEGIKEKVAIKKYDVSRIIKKTIKKIEILDKDIKTYLFVEIKDINNTTIDFIDKKKIITFVGEINQEDDFIVFKENIKYLIEFQPVNDYAYEIKEKERRFIEKPQEEHFKERKSNFSWFFIVVVFYSIFCVFYYLYKNSIILKNPKKIKKKRFKKKN